MIVDTNTGEVINHPIVQHNHMHSYQRQPFTFGNLTKIITIFVVLLLFLNFYKGLYGSTEGIGFVDLLESFATLDDRIDVVTNMEETLTALETIDTTELPDWLEWFGHLWNGVVNILTVASFLIDSLISALTFLLHFLGLIFVG